MAVSGLAVLGATGSIGLSTLDVVARHPERFRVVALAARGDVEGMLRLCERHRPACVAMADPEAADRLRAALRTRALADVAVLEGEQGLERAATHPEADAVMAAIVGAAGLMPTLAAVRAGKRVLLANKEALVMAGPVFIEALRRHRARLIPVDSEHNAVFQCLPPDSSPGEPPPGVRRVILTASGGPFRTLPPAALERVTPEQAVAHPNWEMGRKISVDSATMMNKGLEIIEAHWLFGLPAERIEVVVHPQSIVHSMVEYEDGSILAQLGQPDMRTPIACALAWPERVDSGVAPLDLTMVGRLEFERPDPRRFPCLELARRALAAGGTAPAILNAANEEAVAAFLAGRARFTDIPRVIERTLDGLAPAPATGLDVVLEHDRAARELARAALARLAGPA